MIHSRSIRHMGWWLRNHGSRLVLILSKKLVVLLGLGFQRDPSLLVRHGLVVPLGRRLALDWRTTHSSSRRQRRRCGDSRRRRNDTGRTLFSPGANSIVLLVVLQELLKVLLRVGADLHHTSRFDHDGNLLPLFSVLVEPPQENFVFFGQPTTGVFLELDTIRRRPGKVSVGGVTVAQGGDRGSRGGRNAWRNRRGRGKRWNVGVHRSFCHGRLSLWRTSRRSLRLSSLNLSRLVQARRRQRTNGNKRSSGGWRCGRHIWTSRRRRGRRAQARTTHRTRKRSSLRG